MGGFNWGWQSNLNLSVSLGSAFCTIQCVCVSFLWVHGHCSWDPQLRKNANLTLKLGPMTLFTHLKIILLQCFQFSVFNFQQWPISKQTLRLCLVIIFVFYFQKLIFGNIKKKTILLYFLNQKHVWLVEIKKIVFEKKKENIKICCY